MACPNCRTARTPDHDKEQALATIKALVHNLQTLVFLLDSASSAGQTGMIIANIKDSLLTSFSSCLPKVGGSWQLPQELVQGTIGVLAQFRTLSPRPPKSPTIPKKRAAAVSGENCERSHHPLESWSPLKKRASMEFYYLASMQALERLKGFKSGNNRHEERDILTLIAQIKNLVSCADPSSSLEQAVSQILSNPKYRGTPSGEGELSPMHKDTVVRRTKPTWPGVSEEAPIPLTTPPITQGQGTQQLSPTGNRDMGLHERYSPLSPSCPPSLIASKGLRTHWGEARAEAPRTLGKPDTLTMTGAQQKAPRDTTGVIPKDPEPGPPHSGLFFKNWAAANLTSFADLYKPVLLDYFPIRGIPKEDSPVLIVDSAATPLMFTTFWRNLNLTEAFEIFRWLNVYRSSALNIANPLKKDPVSYGDPVMLQGSAWIPLRCPRATFIQDMQANFKHMYGESSWGRAEIVRLLNTCGTCRSLTIGSFSMPSRILDNSGGPLLHFSIRFDGINVIFQDFPRQLVVPVSQTYTSPGQTLIIVPVLYDPHQAFDYLSTKTNFEVPSQFSWLRWDQVIQGFLGIVPESLLTEAHTKATSQVQGLFVVDIPITARTVTAFSRGVQYETRVRAQVEIRISKSRLARNLRTWEEMDKTLSTTPESIRPDIGPDRTKDGKNPPLELEHERCIECDEFYNAPAAPEPRAVEGQPNPGDSGISIFLWGQGFKEWMNVVFLANPRVSAKHHRVSNPDSGPLSFKNVELSVGGSSGYPLMDRVENQIFRIGAELEISANYGTHSQLHRDICNNLEASTGAIGIFCGGGAESIPSFTAIGPIDTVNGTNIDDIRRSQSGDIQSRSSTHWAKATLQKVLKQLACFRHDFNEVIKINIHIGIEAVSGYDLREIKAIAKAIVLFGGLLNGIGLGPNPSHHKCCADPVERVRSNVNHIQAIDKAPSIEDVAQLMSSLEGSGYTYHGEPGLENQRYDFSCLESQGVIVWTQIFPKLDGKDIIDWISMVLFFNRTTISMDVSLFSDLAAKPITLASLNRFIAKG